MIEAREIAALLATDDWRLTTEEKYACALGQSLIVYFHPVVSRQRPVAS